MICGIHIVRGAKFPRFGGILAVAAFALHEGGEVASIFRIIKPSDHFIVGGKCYCKRHADIAKARRLNGIETEFRDRKSRMIEALVDHPESGLSDELLDARTMYLAAKADYDEARAGAGK